MALPFSDKHFDIAMSSQVYEHVPDAELMMREIHGSYWGSKKRARQFVIHDYTRTIIREPAQFFADCMIKSGSLAVKFANIIATVAFWLVPGHIRVVEKPQST